MSELFRIKLVSVNNNVLVRKFASRKLRKRWLPVNPNGTGMDFHYTVINLCAISRFDTRKFTGHAKSRKETRNKLRYEGHR